MGLFSAKKKTYVSSVVYNMAGPVEDRPDYLKSALLASVLDGAKYKPIAPSVVQAYVGGAGLRLRQYHRWARLNYKQVGIPTDQFMGKPDFSQEAVAAAMLADYQITASIDWIDQGGAEIDMWGRQWLRANMPAKENTDTWVVDYIEATDEGLITFNDGTPPVVFDPVGYRPGGQWLYVSYSRSLTTNRWTTPLMFIYERGTGSAALDVLWEHVTVGGEYLPYIPLRHETKFLSDTYKPEVYKQAKKAYQKATGSKLPDLINGISDNPDLKDIDFAYLMFAVPMNTKDMASRQYLYRYLKLLLENQAYTSEDMDAWLASVPASNAQSTLWKVWLAAQNANPAGSPVTGPAPARPAFSSAPLNSIIIQDNGPGQTNMKMEIVWNDIRLVTGTGLGKPDAKKGDYWFTFVGDQEIVARGYTSEEVENLTIDTVEIHWQKSATQYEKLVVRGFKHINHIYNGKTVEITAAQALVDDDESGFIVPIRYDIFREMSLVDSTQMASQSMMLVFNCYQVVKRKWYQSGWFKILIVIAIIVISIYFPPAGAAAGGTGVLGTAAAVGAALGFSGIVAIIAGTIANLIAAMILTKLITYASVELLGDKIGYIVAAVASFVVIGVGSGMQSGGSFASSLTALMQPTNLLALTSSVGNAYAQAINSDTLGIIKKTEKAYDEYRDKSLELQENYAEQFGYGTAVFNPMSLTEAGGSFFTEPVDAFLGRTLLTGSDIAQMGNDLVTNFVELTLQNEFKE